MEALKIYYFRCFTCHERLPQNASESPRPGICQRCYEQSMKEDSE